MRAPVRVRVRVCVCALCVRRMCVCAHVCPRAYLCDEQGHWLPNADCRVFREPCAAGDAACNLHARECSLTIDVDDSAPTLADGHVCQPRTLVQPCDWAIAPELLGTAGYGLPLGLPIDEAFPFRCASGLLGSAETDFQTSAFCAGRCPPGYICPAEATYLPLPCARGSFCPAGSTVPRPCFQGTYGTATNLSSADDCIPCPAGHECATGSEAPLPCRPGSNASSLGSAVCGLCPAGTYQPELNATSCLACTRSHYCPEGSIMPVGMRPEILEPSVLACKLH